MDFTTVTSPFLFWTTILKPRVWHYGGCLGWLVIFPKHDLFVPKLTHIYHMISLYNVHNEETTHTTLARVLGNLGSLLDMTPEPGRNPSCFKLNSQQLMSLKTF